MLLLLLLLVKIDKLKKNHTYYKKSQIQKTSRRNQLKSCYLEITRHNILVNILARICLWDKL